MVTFLSTHRHRAVPTVLSALFLIASAVGTWAVIPAKAAPAVPTVASSADTPAIVRPTARTPGALVIPKKKKKKVVQHVAAVSAPVVNTAVTSTATNTGTSSTYVAPVTHTAAKKTSSSSSNAADAEFGPG